MSLKQKCLNKQEVTIDKTIYNNWDSPFIYDDLKDDMGIGLYQVYGKHDTVNYFRVI